MGAKLTMKEKNLSAGGVVPHTIGVPPEGKKDPGGVKSNPWEGRQSRKKERRVSPEEGRDSHKRRGPSWAARRSNRQLAKGRGLKDLMTGSKKNEEGGWTQGRGKSYKI